MAWQVAFGEVSPPTATDLRALATTSMGVVGKADYTLLSSLHFLHEDQKGKEGLANGTLIPVGVCYLEEKGSKSRKNA